MITWKNINTLTSYQDLLKDGRVDLVKNKSSNYLIAFFIDDYTGSHYSSISPAGVPCRVIRPITEEDSMKYKPEIAGEYHPAE